MKQVGNFIVNDYKEQAEKQKRNYYSEANDLIGKIKGTFLGEAEQKEVLDKIIEGFKTLTIIKP
jgi:5-methylcytosine-specific restriction endonuclease McrBC regulatory subunit McrC